MTGLFGVAVDVPEPYRGELAGWRKRLGDPNAETTPPHVTLLPPTDLDRVALPAVKEHLAAVAAAFSPFEIRLRGAGTFRPVSAVVFVTLAEGISNCERLQQRVRQGPLARPLRFPYHPHVTVGHDLPDDVLDRGIADLADYRAEFRVEAFTLYEQGADDVWRPLRDFHLTDGAG